jgi:hypothetical protein
MPRNVHFRLHARVKECLVILWIIAAVVSAYLVCVLIFANPFKDKKAVKPPDYEKAWHDFYNN